MYAISSLAGTVALLTPLTPTVDYANLPNSAQSQINLVCPSPDQETVRLPPLNLENIVGEFDSDSIIINPRLPDNYDFVAYNSTGIGNRQRFQDDGKIFEFLRSDEFDSIQIYKKTDGQRHTDPAVTIRRFGNAHYLFFNIMEQYDLVGDPVYNISCYPGWDPKVIFLALNEILPR